MSDALRALVYTGWVARGVDRRVVAAARQRFYARGGTLAVFTRLYCELVRRYGDADDEDVT